ncbi:hypothetical protein [Burkholderia semiarida]|uniref:hypothetical protein n=1 Tax=Burkholderia semiarida TaxID=2843303 RepID=UPI003877AF13
MLLENLSRHLAAHVLIEVHLPDADDRVLQPRIGNDAIFIVQPIGRRGHGVVQLPVAVRQRILPSNITDMMHVPKCV